MRKLALRLALIATALLPLPSHIVIG